MVQKACRHALHPIGEDEKKHCGHRVHKNEL